MLSDNRIISLKFYFILLPRFIFSSRIEVPGSCCRNQFDYDVFSCSCSHDCMYLIPALNPRSLEAPVIGHPLALAVLPVKRAIRIEHVETWAFALSNVIWICEIGLGCSLITSIDPVRFVECISMIIFNPRRLTVNGHCATTCRYQS